MTVNLPSANIDGQTSIYCYNIKMKKVTNGKLKILAASKDVTLSEILGEIVEDWFIRTSKDNKIEVIDNFIRNKINAEELISDEIH